MNSPTYSARKKYTNYLRIDTTTTTFHSKRVQFPHTAPFILCHPKNSKSCANIFKNTSEPNGFATHNPPVLHQSSSRRNPMELSDYVSITEVSTNSQSRTATRYHSSANYWKE